MTSKDEYHFDKFLNHPPVYKKRNPFRVCLRFRFQPSPSYFLLKKLRIPMFMKAFYFRCNSQEVSTEDENSVFKGITRYRTNLPFPQRGRDGRKCFKSLIRTSLLSP